MKDENYHISITVNADAEKILKISAMLPDGGRQTLKAVQVN